MATISSVGSFVGHPPPLSGPSPSPGALIHFPASYSSSEQKISPLTRTLNPTVTGSSVLGVTFADGVMMAADTLGSYGSLARFRSISRLKKVTDHCVFGASGDYADFQFISRLLRDITTESDSLDDGHVYSTQSLFSWMSRVMYYRRTEFNPFWNTVLVGGCEDGKPFLGFVNSIGVAYQSPTLATGFGSYLAQPLLREAYEKNSAMTKQDAQELLERCLRILYYRDGRSFNKYELAVITKDGVEVSEPLTLQGTNWDVARYVQGYD